MKKDKVKSIVSELLNEGISLSDIQKELSRKHNITLTFLELRLMASELKEVDWTKQKDEMATQKKVDIENEKKLKELSENSEVQETGKTTVELNKVSRPGAIASGSVVFASGSTADWVLDQMGRLGLEKKYGEPTEKDLEEFQEELHSAISKSGI